MDVGIFNELASPNAIGGAEFYSAVLAADLRHAHRVEIINHNPYFTIDNLSLYSGLDLGGVRHRYLPRTPAAAGAARNPWQRYREAWSRGADISERYDLFINLTLTSRPLPRAEGVLLVLSHSPSGGTSRDTAAIACEHEGVHKWEWQRRLAIPGQGVSPSSPAHGRALWSWTARCCIHLRQPASRGRQRNSIVSVGRFSAGWHLKDSWRWSNSSVNCARADWPGWSTPAWAE